MSCDIPDGDITGNTQTAFCKAGKDSLDMALAAAEECQWGWTLHHLISSGVMYGNANPGTSLCNCDDAVDMKRAYAHRIGRALSRCGCEFERDPEPKGKHSRKGSSR